MKVTYIDHMGSDLRVADAARVSFKKKSELVNGVLQEKDEKLIKYLGEHNHWTPFAHPHITVLVEAPIPIARQLFKHKIGFVENEVSRRYVDEDPEFYMPDKWRKRAENKKQGSSEEVVKDFTRGCFYQGSISSHVSDHYDKSLLLYREMIDSGTCPEQSRMVLPQAMMTQWYWTGSLAAFARVYGLRSTPDAQAEVRVIADQIDEIMRPLFPVAWSKLVCD